MVLSQIIFAIGLIALTLTAAIWDVRTRRVPNWLTVSGFVCGLLFHLVTGGLMGLGWSLAGFGVGFGILLVLWLIGGGGGGDVKLMGAVGAWLGPWPTLIVFFLSAVIAVVGSFGRTVYINATSGFGAGRKQLVSEGSSGRRKFFDTSPEAQAERAKRRLLPFALPVALGVWAYLLWQCFAG